ISVAVLVPVDLAPQMEPLPRLGPTRALLFAFLAGWTARALVDRQVRRPPAHPRRPHRGGERGCGLRSGHAFQPDLLALSLGDDRVPPRPASGAVDLL